MKKQQEILIRPILTEKMLRLQDEQNKYGFVVSLSANKIEIRREIEKKFDVLVDNVRTVKVKGKTKQTNTRSGISRGRRPDWKKAIVTLREGDSIDFFETT